MKEIDKYHVVASAVRVEHDEQSDDLFLVFEITDEEFKHQIKTDWMKDINLKIINKKLVTFEEK